MKRYLVALGLLLGLVGLAGPSAATQFDYGVSCLKREAIGNYLGRAFNEARVATGELENGNPIEIFASRNGSWTMVELTADGYGCVRSYGHGLQVQGNNQSKRPAS